MSKKKEKYVPLVGITGVGEDYNIYNLSLVEKATGFVIGLAAGLRQRTLCLVCSLPA